MQKRFLKYFIISVAVTVLASFNLHAQQTAYGETFVGLSASADFPYFTGLGAEIEVGTYRSAICFGGNLSMQDRSVLESNSGERLHYIRWTLGPELMWRLFGNKARTLSVYLGGDAFFGTETLDTWKTLSPETWQGLTVGTTEDNSFKESTVIYGAGARAEVEFFPLPRLAVTARIRPNVCLGGQFRWFKCEVSAGVRYNFFL